MIYEASKGQFNGLFNDIYQKIGEEGLKKSFYLTGTKKIETGERGDPCVVILPTNIGNADKNNWHSINQTNSSLYIHFKYFSFAMSDYSIRVRNDIDFYFPSEYLFECSNDNKTWSLLHHFDSPELSHIGASATFHINKTKSCNYYRFIQLKTELQYRDYFVLNRIEFFGMIIFVKRQTCKFIRRNNANYMFCLLLFYSQ